MSNDFKLNNDVAFVYKWVIQNVYKLLWHEDVLSDFTLNGISIKYNFLWNVNINEPINVFI